MTVLRDITIYSQYIGVKYYYWTGLYVFKIISVEILRTYKKSGFFKIEHWHILSFWIKNTPWQTFLSTPTSSHLSMASPLPLQLLLQLRIEGEVDLTEEDGQEETVPGGGRGETQNTKQTFQCHTCDDNIKCSNTRTISKHF